MCDCKNVTIEPTEENSWGVRDTYIVRCSICRKKLTNGTVEDISNYILSNKCFINDGEKYLPMDLLKQLKERI